MRIDKNTESMADFDRLVKLKEEGVNVPNRVVLQSASKRIEEAKEVGGLTTEMQKKDIWEKLTSVFGIGKK